MRLVSTVKAGAFWPRPEVDSAVVRIDVAERHLLSAGEQGSGGAGETSFFRVVRAGFSEKRKQLKNNLRQLGLSDDEIAAGLAGVGIDGRRRAETLAIAEWEALSQAIVADRDV